MNRDSSTVEGQNYFNDCDGVARVISPSHDHSWSHTVALLAGIILRLRIVSLIR